MAPHEIRIATLDDIPEMLELARQFHAYSPWRDIPFDAESAKAFGAGMIIGGIVFLSEEGMLGGVLHPLYFNPAFKVAAEMFWWAPKGGGALRAAFEAWAHSNGAAGIQFSSLADDRAPALARMFRRAGFVPVETGYFKRLAA